MREQTKSRIREIWTFAVTLNVRAICSLNGQIYGRERFLANSHFSRNKKIRKAQPNLQQQQQQQQIDADRLLFTAI